MNMTTVFVEGDPYLAYQPAFSKSLPVQLFVNGITITLLIVLLFHLLCESSTFSSMDVVADTIVQSPRSTTTLSPRSTTASNSSLSS